jgi:predicted O-methyltransferase YrrM
MEVFNWIKSTIDIPSEDEVTSVADSQGEVLYRLIKENGLKRTLEVGFAYGKSGAYIMSASQNHHVAIDPYQERFQNIGVRNIERLGLGEKLELHRDFSHVVLPQLLNEQRSFDFIFIDGDHRFDGIFVDFFYADRLLDMGGFIVFHDTWMRSTCLVESFVKKNRKDFKNIRVEDENLGVFQRVAWDTRDWIHFKEFYTMKSYTKFQIMSDLIGQKEEQN